MAARGRLVSQIEQPPDSPGHRAFGKTDRQVDRDPLDGRLSKKSSQHRNKPLRIEPLALREHARQFRRGRERGGGVFLADGRPFRIVTAGVALALLEKRPVEAARRRCGATDEKPLTQERTAADAHKRRERLRKKTIWCGGSRSEG